MVVARVVETQRKPLENIGNRAKSAETQGSADSDDSRLDSDSGSFQDQVQQALCLGPVVYL